MISRMEEQILARIIKEHSTRTDDILNQRTIEQTLKILNDCGLLHEEASRKVIEDGRI